jgi:hypothetical protein
MERCNHRGREHRQGPGCLKFENPAYFPFIQREAGEVEGTINYSSSSEAITVSLHTLFESSIGLTRTFSLNRQAINISSKIFSKMKTDLIGTNELKKIKEDKHKKLKLTEILSAASTLTSIGKLVAPVFGL